MTQQEVMKVLKRFKTWKKTSEIAAKVPCSTKNVAASLRRLFKQGYVLRKSERISKASIVQERVGNAEWMWLLK